MDALTPELVLWCSQPISGPTAQARTRRPGSRRPAPCTPLPQAVEFYNALVEAGCETELVVYPREGHGWTEREHLLDSWDRVRDWLTRYV
jgi:acetyl esterase/lipase